MGGGLVASNLFGQLKKALELLIFHSICYKDSNTSIAMLVAMSIRADRVILLININGQTGLVYMMVISSNLLYCGSFT